LRDLLLGGDEGVDVAAHAEDEFEFALFVEKEFADDFGPDVAAILVGLAQAGATGGQTGQPSIDHFEAKRKSLGGMYAIFFADRLERWAGHDFFWRKTTLLEYRRADVNEASVLIYDPVNILSRLVDFLQKVHAAGKGSELSVIHLSTRSD